MSRPRATAAAIVSPRWLRSDVAGATYPPHDDLPRLTLLRTIVSLACLLSTPLLIAFNINRNRSHTQATCGSPIAGALTKCISIAFVVFLVGCESVKPLTTRIETVQIKVPIAIPCIAKSDIPVVPNLTAPTNGTPDQMAAWVSALVLLLDRYTDEADIIIRGCAK